VTEERFDLVFDGRLATGFSQAQVRQNMAELFSLGDTQLEALFSGRVVILKRGLDKGQAIRFRNRLAQAGALGLIRPADTAQAEPAAAKPAASTSVPKAAAAKPAAAKPTAPQPQVARPAAPQPAPAITQAASLPAQAAPKQVVATPAPAPAAVAMPAAAVEQPAKSVAAAGGDAITCPRCGHEQPRSDSCGACRMDLRLHLQRLEKRARIVAAARRG